VDVYDRIWTGAAMSTGRVMRKVILLLTGTVLSLSACADHHDAYGGPYYGTWPFWEGCCGFAHDRIVFSDRDRHRFHHHFHHDGRHYGSVRHAGYVRHGGWGHGIAGHGGHGRGGRR
jgi:hypothetical protein